MNRPTTRPEELLPLTSVAFEILLALSTGEAHGYAILRAVEERTGGATSLHAGTLYRALARLVETGLIEEMEDAPAEGGDERRRYYALTPLGRSVARAEASMNFWSLVTTSRSRWRSSNSCGVIRK